MCAYVCVCERECVCVFVIYEHILHMINTYICIQIYDYWKACSELHEGSINSACTRIKALLRLFKGTKALKGTQNLSRL